jgi:hypothetical protein
MDRVVLYPGWDTLYSAQDRAAIPRKRDRNSSNGTIVLSIVIVVAPGPDNSANMLSITELICHVHEPQELNSFKLRLP